MTRQRLTPRARAASMTLAALLAVPLLTQVARPGAQQPLAQVSEELRWRVERLRATGHLQIGEEVVTDRPLTQAVYESRGYRPLWSDKAASASLARAVSHAADDGLRPADYHVSRLARPGDDTDDPGAVAELDLLRTDALVRLGHDLRFGRSDVRTAGEAGAGWPGGDPGAVEVLVEIVASGAVQEALSALRPTHFA